MSYGYDALSNRETVTDKTCRMAYSYDDAGRLVEIEHTDADEVMLARYEYVLDKIGNRTAVTETLRLYHVYLPIIMRNAGGTQAASASAPATMPATSPDDQLLSSPLAKPAVPVLRSPLPTPEAPQQIETEPDARLSLPQRLWQALQQWVRDIAQTDRALAAPFSAQPLMSPMSCLRRSSSPPVTGR